MNKFDKEMQLLLKKEGLNSEDVFCADYETFEEIPLFSRWSHISFLSSLSFNEKNKLLINTCLELITEKYNSLSVKFDDYFICLSLTNWDDYEEINCLTPNFFISRRASWLTSNLKLQCFQSIEENLIKEYLFSLKLSGFNVYVSNDLKENKRVYVISDLIFKGCYQ